MARNSKSSGGKKLPASSQRVNVTLPAVTYQELLDIAEDNNVSLSEAAKRAIKRDISLRKLEEEGGKILVQFPDGQIAHIMPNE